MKKLTARKREEGGMLVPTHSKRRLLRWPRPGRFGVFAEGLVNGAMARMLRRFSRFFPVLRSDIQEVVYLNWVIPTSRVQGFLPKKELQLDVFGEDGEWTILSTLTYRHGHFAPRFFGPLRRLFPSPIQSNWRLYLANTSPCEGSGSSPQESVYFLMNMISSPLYVLGARLFSSGLKGHLPMSMQHEYGEGRWRSTFFPGAGSSSDFDVEVLSTGNFAMESTLPKSFARLFESSESALLYLSKQTGAVDWSEEQRVWRRSKICLTMDLESALEGHLQRFESAWLSEIVGDAKCFAFVLPRVKFEFLGEVDLP